MGVTLERVRELWRRRDALYQEAMALVEAEDTDEDKLIDFVDKCISLGGEWDVVLVPR